jgi:hypothetical protein
MREPGRWWSRATDFQEGVASVGLIVGRQAHPSFGSKFIVSLVEPQPDARSRSPTIKATSNDGDQAASQISGTHPFSVSGGYPLHCRPLNNEPAFMAATLPAVRPGIRSMRPGYNASRERRNRTERCQCRTVQQSDVVALDALDAARNMF